MAILMGVLSQRVAWQKRGRRNDIACHYLRVDNLRVPLILPARVSFSFHETDPVPENRTHLPSFLFLIGPGNHRKNGIKALKPQPANFSNSSIFGIVTDYIIRKKNIDRRIFRSTPSIAFNSI